MLLIHMMVFVVMRPSLCCKVLGGESVIIGNQFAPADLEKRECLPPIANQVPQNESSAPIDPRLVDV